MFNMRKVIWCHDAIVWKRCLTSGIFFVESTAIIKKVKSMLGGFILLFPSLGRYTHSFDQQRMLTHSSNNISNKNKQN